MQRGNETKSRIYNAAKELFYENGYSGTTIQQIAQRAGTTLGGTTYHYNTKEKFISQNVFKTTTGAELVKIY